MNQVTATEFLKLFDEDRHPAMLESINRYPDATACVRFENMDFCSSQLGAATGVVVGPSNTFTSVEFCKGKWLNDLPSQRQYPHAWCEADELRAALTRGMTR